MRNLKKILFVCIENANRSQMAEAFAAIIGKDKVEAYSAGSRPSGKISEKAIRSMREVGYDLTAHASKSVDSFVNLSFDVVVTMGCGDDCPNIVAGRREDWDIPDPRNLDETEFNKVRELILIRVGGLINSL